MSAFTPSFIPTSGTNAVTTVEQAFLNLAGFLAEANRTAQLVPDPNNPQVVERVSIKTGNDANGQANALIVAYIPIANDFAANGKKLFANAQEISTVAVYDRYKS